MSGGPNPSGICLCGCGQATPLAKVTRTATGDVRGTPRRYAKLGCQNRANLPSIQERFWARVDTSGGPAACWLWTGSLVAGYGQFVPTHDARYRAHRFSFELALGPIPEGLYLDHLCHTRDLACPGGECAHRACVNPSHLEPVTPRENVMRAHRAPPAINAQKTHCNNGHPFSGDNLGVYSGHRYCRACGRAKDLERYHRTKILVGRYSS